jgi:hypothetical protein
VSLGFVVFARTCTGTTGPGFGGSATSCKAVECGGDVPVNQACEVGAGEAAGERWAVSCSWLRSCARLQGQEQENEGGGVDSQICCDEKRGPLSGPRYT